MGTPGTALNSRRTPGMAGMSLDFPHQLGGVFSGNPGTGTPGMGMDLRRTPGIPTVPGVKGGSSAYNATFGHVPNHLQNIFCGHINALSARNVRFWHPEVIF